MEVLIFSILFLTAVIIGTGLYVNSRLQDSIRERDKLAARVQEAHLRNENAHESMQKVDREIVADSERLMQILESHRSNIAVLNTNISVVSSEIEDAISKKADLYPNMRRLKELGSNVEAGRAQYATYQRAVGSNLVPEIDALYQSVGQGYSNLSRRLGELDPVVFEKQRLDNLRSKLRDYDAGAYATASNLHATYAGVFQDLVSTGRTLDKLQTLSNYARESDFTEMMGKIGFLKSVAGTPLTDIYTDMKGAIDSAGADLEALGSYLKDGTVSGVAAKLGDVTNADLKEGLPYAYSRLGNIDFQPYRSELESLKSNSDAIDGMLALQAGRSNLRGGDVSGLQSKLAEIRAVNSNNSGALDTHTGALNAYYGAQVATAFKSDPYQPTKLVTKQLCIGGTGDANCIGFKDLDVALKARGLAGTSNIS
jgi:hypothetical protein